MNIISWGTFWTIREKKMYKKKWLLTEIKRMARKIDDMFLLMIANIKPIINSLSTNNTANSFFSVLVAAQRIAKSKKGQFLC